MQGILTGSDSIIVATGAGTDNLRMVHGTRQHRQPGRRTCHMTGLAEVGSGYVQSGFTGGFNTVVATDTSANDLGMIDCGGDYL